MTKIPKTRMIDFLSKLVTEYTFPIITILLTLRDNNNFNTILELLYEKKINLAMLSRLPIIDDVEIDNFIRDYYSKLYPTNPDMTIDPSKITFNANEYLFIKDNEGNNPVNTLITKYNEYSNATFNNTSYHYKIGNYKVLYGYKDRLCYSNIDEFKTKFFSSVNREICKKYGVENVSEIFKENEFTTPCSIRFNNVILKKFKDIVNDLDLYKLNISLNNDYSYRELFISEFSEIENFEEYSDNLYDIVFNELFILANNGSGYDMNMANNLIYEFNNFEFTGYLSHDITFLKFIIAKIKVFNIYNPVGTIDVTSLEKSLSEIIYGINKFVGFVKEMDTNISKNILFI